MTRIPQLPLVKQICENYMTRNWHWKRFPRSKFNWTKCKLDILHQLTYMNPCLSVQTSSSHYFFIFMDDFSHHTWMYFLRKKGQKHLQYSKHSRKWKIMMLVKKLKFWKKIRAKNTRPRPSFITTTNLKSTSNSHKLKCYNIMKFRRKRILL
jgi:hypothetical protein